METSYRYFENQKCKYYPCHKGSNEINCLFCYCPLYYLPDCPGNYRFVDSNGTRIKECTDCTFPHKAENYDRIIEILSKKNRIS